MTDSIQKIKGFRSFLLNQIDGLSEDQLNLIPSGFNNNIAWNLGHMTSVLQNMCYVKSGLPVTIPSELFERYLSGTKPDRRVTAGEIHQIKEVFAICTDRLQSDLDVGSFKTYTPSLPILNIYGFEVRDIHSALEYVLYHDGLHAGQILSLKRLATVSK